jgi:hypothetical protein
MGSVGVADNRVDGIEDEQRFFMNDLVRAQLQLN